jgi:DNA-directed RNA polymerase specialized sigma24 family protein
MYTKDNERMTQANVNAEHRCNLIRISDYYSDNCSEQEMVEVSDEILMALQRFKKDDENLRKSDERHLAVGLRYDNDEYMAATFGLYSESSAESIELRIWLEQVLCDFSQIVARRAMLYFLEGLSARAIAELEGVHHSSVTKSIEKTKKRLLELLE